MAPIQFIVGQLQRRVQTKAMVADNKDKVARVKRRETREERIRETDPKSSEMSSEMAVRWLRADESKKEIENTGTRIPSANMDTAHLHGCGKLSNRMTVDERL